MNIKYMNTIEDRIKDCKMWKQSEENLKSFKETMNLVKQYYIKHTKQAPPSPLYEIPSDLFPYLF